ncbi:MAG TPA: hypothetical protein VJ998_06060 [Pseudomonadales bacterium]|nr:hypothetical protein [Pseudomonadales bacterium]
MKSIYEIQAFNDALESENRIHDDDVARRFGFEAGLVPGVVVFGHMAYLPLKAQGEAWMTNNQVEVRFLKPAYDGDILTIEHDTDDGGSKTQCINAVKTLLCSMTSQHQSTAPDPAWQIAPANQMAERQEISWDNLYTDKAAPAHIWRADFGTNLDLAEQLEDDLEIYRNENAVVHPFWILRQCNAAFERSFILPMWLHVGSKIRFHKPLRVGQEIETRMVPIDKWENKGHQFTTLYIPFIVGDEVYVEVEHTSIFRIAPPKG